MRSIAICKKCPSFRTVDNLLNEFKQNFKEAKYNDDDKAIKVFTRLIFDIQKDLKHPDKVKNHMWCNCIRDKDSNDGRSELSVRKFRCRRVKNECDFYFEQTILEQGEER